MTSLPWVSVLEPHSQMKNSADTSYVIITPAKNEEFYIRNVLDSVTSQTCKPLKWVIVDDSSEDHTAEVVSEYARKYDFISLVRLENQNQRNFAKKANAFRYGLEQLGPLDYKYIGNLDADVSFAPEYFQNIMTMFVKNPKLGISGGSVCTKVGNDFIYGDTTIDSVGGAVQLFRKECFEQIGGYRPLEHGGIDAAAEITARMKGWTVRKSLDDRVWEHRTTGTANSGILTASFRLGMRFHSLGYGTLFYLMRSVTRMKYKPYIIGSMLALAGFFYAKVRGCPIALPDEIVTYLRKEQISKLKQKLFDGTTD